MPRPRRPLHRRRSPALLPAVVLAALLTATSGGYGYHRDELYFRMLHPAWGYVDQPPLAPLLAHLTQAVADTPWAMRLPATVATVLAVVVVTLVTRELGGDRRAQALCAWGFAFGGFTLVLGHTMLTASIDLPVWPAILLFVLRAQLRREPRWWLAAGVVTGLASYNKLLVVVLLVALAGGIVLVGPRRLLWSPWVLAGLTVALVLAVPNVVYQATHGWPQIGMGRALASDNAGSVRVEMWPFLLVLLGPPLVPVWVAGLVGLARRPEWAPVRFVAAAFPVLLALVFVMGAQFYYPFGLLAVLFAAGCVPTAAWMRSTGRTGLVVAAVALNAAVGVVIALPVIPLHRLGSTPVPSMNQAAQDTVGWPTYVREIAAAYRTVPAADRPHTVVVTSNYGEAGAVARYGDAYGLPAVFSGHNALYDQARPPAGATTAVVVGGQYDHAAPLFAGCRVVTRLDDRVGVDNEEQGEPVAVCRDPRGGWPAVWPQLRHED